MSVDDRAGGAGRRLVGWKELARYLGTSPRTVQRWEQEKGLPVHRVPGSNGHSVFADSGELDRWLESKGSRPAAAVVEGREDVLGRMRRHPATRAAAVACLVFAIAALGAGWVRAHSEKWHKSAKLHPVKAAVESPVITSVSAVQAKANQVIDIKGLGLGIHTYYANGDTPYIAIRDLTARWAAGRIIPENWDEVTLNVAYWTDSEIVVTGFAGAYNQHWWRLNPGDQIEVAIWNPQTQAGPATYHLTVDSQQLAQK